MKKNKTPLLKYEPEADVLSWEISHAPIDYAAEVGDIIVHFSKDHRPVLIEVLHARHFTRRAERLIGAKELDRIGQK